MPLQRNSPVSRNFVKRSSKARSLKSKRKKSNLRPPPQLPSLLFTKMSHQMMKIARELSLRKKSSLHLRRSKGKLGVTVRRRSHQRVGKKKK